MSYKNTFKIFITRFGLIWSLLLYMAVIIGIIVGLSMPFLIPIIKALNQEGLVNQFYAIFDELLSGDGLSQFFASLSTFLKDFFALFAANKTLFRSSAFYITFILIFAFRFLNGLYEIPLSVVFDGWMSSKAKYGFFGKLVSSLGLSIRFVLAKLLYTVLFDSVVICIFYGLFTVMNVNMLMPFVIILTFIIIYSFRFSLTSMWASSIVSEKMGIFKAFIFSVKMCFKNFKSVYTCFIFTWLLIIVVNMLFGIFTFGVAFLVTIPISILFITVLNMTLHFSKNGKRYYVDSVIVTPPIQTTIDDFME